MGKIYGFVVEDVSQKKKTSGPAHGNLLWAIRQKDPPTLPH